MSTPDLNELAASRSAEEKLSARILDELLIDMLAERRIIADKQAYYRLKRKVDTQKIKQRLCEGGLNCVECTCKLVPDEYRLDFGNWLLIVRYVLGVTKAVA